MRSVPSTILSPGNGSALYTPQHIANYFLKKAEAESRPISQMKLLKLVYIAYGWVLALLGERLFDEPIQAWKHGPVIPTLYHEFKHFGSEPITTLSTYFDLDSWDTTVPLVPARDGNVLPILDKVWAAYKKFSASALRAKTHEDGTPWSQSFGQGRSNQVIEDELIRSHFRKKIGEILDTAERAS